MTPSSTPARGTTASDVLRGQDLTGTLALVTGGYSGLGLETTLALARHGAQVVVPARRPESAREALAGVTGVEVETLDLADQESIRSFTDRFLGNAAQLRQDAERSTDAAVAQRVDELLELPWLPGYEHSSPVRIGNAATRQVQLDVYGEVMDAMHQARRAGIEPDETAWALQRAVMDHLEGAWEQPDQGIWEVRGKRRHFTHSKVMAWVAMDRAVKAVEQFKLEGPLTRWQAIRDTIHQQVCHDGYHGGRHTFVQYYAVVRVWIPADRSWDVQYVAQEYFADFTYGWDTQA